MESFLQNPMSFVIIAVAIWFLHRLWKTYSQRKIVRDLSAKYQHVLAKKRAQLLVEDDYGDLDPDKWINEAQGFFSKKIEPHLDKKWEKYISGKKIGSIIEDAALDYQERQPDLFQLMNLWTVSSTSTIVPIFFGVLGGLRQFQKPVTIKVLTYWRRTIGCQ